MRRLAFLLTALLLAGCSGSAPPSETTDRDGDGFVDAVEALYESDPADNRSVPDVVRTQEVVLSDSVDVVGTGVPTVQCPADMVNSQLITWTVTADTGDANQTWVADLEVSIAGGATVNDVDLFVTDPAGKAVGSATGSTNQETVTSAGPRPLGDYVVEVRGCSGAGTVSVSGHAVVHWVPSTAELLAGAPAGA